MTGRERRIGAAILVATLALVAWWLRPETAETGVAPAPASASLSAPAVGTRGVARPKRLRAATPDSDQSPDDGSSPAVRVERIGPVGRVSGVVRAPDGALVTGATVWATQHEEVGGESLRESAQTDDDGRYVINSLRLGVRYDLDCNVDGFASPAFYDDVTTTADAPEAVHDFLLRSYASLVVVVLGADGAAVPSARADYSRAGSKRGGRAVNAGRGAARFDRLEPGTVTVRAWSDDSAHTTADATLAAGETTSISITLRPAFVIEGVVVDDAGAPVAGAEIRSRGDAASALDTRWRGTSGADGTFRISARLGGERPIDVRADGHVGARADATPGGALVRVVLQRAATIRFTFRTSAGGAIARYSWHVLDENGVAITDGSGSTADDGRTGVVEVPLTARQLRFHADDHVDAVVAVRAALGETTDLGEITLDRGAGVVGRVVGCSGAELRGTNVNVLDAGRGSVLGSASLRPDGTFAIHGMAPGPVRVRVWVSDFVQTTVATEASTDPTPVTITMRRGCLLTVRAVESDGLPALGVEIAAVATDDTASFMRRLDAGRFATRLPPGRWRIVATRGDVRAEETVDAAEGATHEVTLRLGR